MIYKIIILNNVIYLYYLIIKFIYIYKCFILKIKIILIGMEL